MRDFTSILVVDWPSREVPERLARAGYDVVVHGGPGPEDFTAYELVDDEVVVRRTGAPPAHVDLLYTFRPIEELPALIEVAVGLGATTVWVQSGLDAAGEADRRGCWLPESEAAWARSVVEASGLAYVDAPYIVDALAGDPGGPDDQGDLEG